MLFPVTNIYSYESDYVMLHSVVNIMAKNSVKMSHKMSQKWFLVINIWYLSDKHTMTDTVLWLSCYVYIFAI